MGRGFSIKSFAGNIGVDETTIYEWISKHKDFSQSIKRGKAKSALFWEQMGMLAMMGKIPDFNTTIWIFQMKNRFGWSDKLSVDVEANETKGRPQLSTNDDEESPHDAIIRIMKKYGKEIGAYN